MRTGELLVRAARAVRVITIPSLPVSLARIEHGQTNQKPTCAPGYNKKKNALTSPPPAAGLSVCSRSCFRCFAFGLLSAFSFPYGLQQRPSKSLSMSTVIALERQLTKKWRLSNMLSRHFVKG